MNRVHGIDKIIRFIYFTANILFKCSQLIILSTFTVINHQKVINIFNFYTVFFWVFYIIANTLSKAPFKKIFFSSYREKNNGNCLYRTALQFVRLLKINILITLVSLKFLNALTIIETFESLPFIVYLNHIFKF